MMAALARLMDTLLTSVLANWVYERSKPLLRRKWAGVAGLIVLTLLVSLVANRDYVKPWLTRTVLWGTAGGHDLNLKVAVFMETGTEGTAIKNGVRMALSDFTPKLERVGVTVNIADQEISYPADRDALRKLATALSQDRSVMGVVGPMNGDVAAVIAPVFGKTEMVMVAPYNTTPSITDAPDQNIIRLGYSDREQARVAAWFAVKQLGAKKIAVVWFKDTGTVDYVGGAFVRELRSHGATAVNGFGNGQPLDVRANDHRSALDSILATKPDIIYCSFVSSRASEAAIFFRQAREMGFTGQFMATDQMNARSAIRTYASDAVQGMYFTSYGADFNSEAGQRFRQAYLRAHLEEPPPLAAYGYDSARVLLEGILQAVSDRTPATRTKVLRAVRQTKDVKGLTGEIAFDTRGENSKATVHVFRYDGSNITQLEYVGLPN